MIVVIPAKGTSRRVQGKNMRPLAGKPLFMWTVEAALEADVGRVVVSTEDAEIAKLSAIAGASVIDRPGELACDPAEAPDVALHAVSEAEDWGWEFRSVVMLLPTSPFRNARHIREAVALHRDTNRNVLSVVEAPEIRRKLHTPWPHDGSMCPRVIGRPMLLNGAIWIADKGRLQAVGYFSGHYAMPYVMEPDVGIDIDTEADFAAAEWIARGLRG